METERFAVLLTHSATPHEDQVGPPAVCRKWQNPLASAIFDTLDQAETEVAVYRRRFPDAVYEVWKMTPVS